MSSRHEDRLDTWASAQDGTDHFATMVKRLPCASFVGNRIVTTDEEGFADADRGRIADDAYMAGNPKASWMRIAMPVAEQQIGLRFERVERRNCRRQFPE